MKSVVSSLLFIPTLAMASGYFENPLPGSVQSGVGVVSGWHCSASQIEVQVDGVSIGETGVGSVRDDTVSICGHNKSGYALLYNYNIPEPGVHTMTVYADGVLLEERKFTTMRSGGVPFLTNKSATITIPNFPESGKSTTVEWSQAQQRFVVVGSADITTLDGNYVLRRASLQTQHYGLLDTEGKDFKSTGTMTVARNSYRQQFSVQVDNSAPSTTDIKGYMWDRGHYLYDPASGSKIIVVERGAALITSRLAFDSTLGWFNEIDYWVKVK